MVQLKIVKRGVKDFSFIENFLQEKLQGETVKTVTISENVYDKICSRYGRFLKYYIDRYKIQEGLYFCNENYSFEIGREIYGKYGYFYKMKIIDNKKYIAERFFERIDAIREQNKFFYDEEVERMYCKAVRMQEEELFNPFQDNFVEGQLIKTKKMDETRNKIDDLFDKIEDRMDHLKERKARLSAESAKEEAEMLAQLQKEKEIADSKAKEDLKKLENIKLNERYTIVASDSSILGSTMCQVIKCTIKDIQLVQYAQYNNALQITYRKYRGRKDSILTIVESDSICILKGLHDIESSIKTQLDEISFTSVANDPKNYFNNADTVFFKAKHEVINTNNNNADYDLLTDLVCDYVTDRIVAGETKEEIKDDNYYSFLKNTVIENNITLNDNLFNYLSNEGYDDLVEDLKSITFNTETVEIENQKQDLQNPESLYQFIKDTFMDTVNKLRSDNSYKAFRKFINTYLQEININYIRMGQHLSINSFKKILTECKTLKEFKRVIVLIGKEYGNKCVVDTYTNMLDDLKTFQEDGDLEEVEEIKQQLQTCIKLTDNLILY